MGALLFFFHSSFALVPLNFESGFYKWNMYSFSGKCFFTKLALHSPGSVPLSEPPPLPPLWIVRLQTIPVALFAMVCAPPCVRTLTVFLSYFHVSQGVSASASISSSHRGGIPTTASFVAVPITEVRKRSVTWNNKRTCPSKTGLIKSLHPRFSGNAQRLRF